MSTEIYFLRDKKKSEKKATKWRRYFVLEKRLDGKSKRRSNARAGAAGPARDNGAVSLNAAPVLSFTHLLLLWVGREKHRWGQNGMEMGGLEAEALK